MKKLNTYEPNTRAYELSEEEYQKLKSAIDQKTQAAEKKLQILELLFSDDE